jgi:hypothetical protein
MPGHYRNLTMKSDSRCFHRDWRMGLSMPSPRKAAAR